MDSTTDNPPISANEEDNLRLAAQIASVNLLYAQREVANRIIDPSLPTKVLLDLAEHSYRVSGAAKKAEQKDVGPGFSIVINLPGGQTATIGKQEPEKPDIIGELVKEVRPLVDWSAAPEFSSPEID